jgi:hypothetical protein
MDMAMLALKALEQTGSLAVVALAQARDDDAGDRTLPGAKIGKAGFRAPEEAGPGRAGLAALGARQQLTVCGGMSREQLGLAVRQAGGRDTGAAIVAERPPLAQHGALPALIAQGPGLRTLAVLPVIPTPVD